MNPTIAQLAVKLHDLASRGSRTIGTAESCTGGLIAGAITAVSGSSHYFYGGIVSYDNSVKENLLCVPASVLRTVGAVSSECAHAMAVGAANALGVDLTVSVTGIAGPEGGSVEKPVGTVWFGLYDRGTIATEVRQFGGDRAAVRQATVIHALTLLCRALER